MNVTKEAKRANGNSRACAKCPVLKAHKVCPETYMKVCSNSFVDGFKKGVKRHEQEARKQIEDIKQKAIEAHRRACPNWNCCYNRIGHVSCTIKNCDYVKRFVELINEK